MVEERNFIDSFISYESPAAHTQPAQAPEEVRDLHEEPLTVRAVVCSLEQQGRLAACRVGLCIKKCGSNALVVFGDMTFVR